MTLYFTNVLYQKLYNLGHFTDIKADKNKHSDKNCNENVA